MCAQRSGALSGNSSKPWKLCTGAFPVPGSPELWANLLPPLRCRRCVPPLRGSHLHCLRTAWACHHPCHHPLSHQPARSALKCETLTKNPSPLAPQRSEQVLGRVAMLEGCCGALNRLPAAPRSPPRVTAHARLARRRNAGPRSLARSLVRPLHAVSVLHCTALQPGMAGSILIMATSATKLTDGRDTGCW